MFPAPFLFIFLVLISPVYLIVDGPITYGVVAAAAAILVAIVAVRVRPGEAAVWSSLVRLIAIGAALPVLLIVLQLIPVRAIGLANPIWQSAAAALPRPVVGSISIDIGASLISLSRYLSFAALALVATAIAIDRRRAGWLLFAITTASTLAAVLVIAAKSGGMGIANEPALVVAGTDSAVLGIVISLGAMLHTRQHPAAGQTRPAVARLAFVLSLTAVAICALAVVIGATSQVYFALAFGVGTLVVAIVMRRLNPDVWGYSAIVGIIVLAAVAFFSVRPTERAIDLTVAFTSMPQAPLTTLTQRILAETGWLGTGAGTFATVLPIYKDATEISVGGYPPTAAAAIAVEMGKPFLWLAVIASFALVIMLLRGAVRRGRDPYFSITASSCVVVTLLLAFNNYGVFSTSILVIAAAAIGMGVAQSKSRSV